MKNDTRDYSKLKRSLTIETVGAYVPWVKAEVTDIGDDYFWAKDLEGAIGCKGTKFRYSFDSEEWRFLPDQPSQPQNPQLPRWIKGSDVCPGMTIVGNTNSDGYSTSYMWTATILDIKEKSYDTGSSQIYWRDIDAIYTNLDNSQDPSGEGRIWSHNMFLLVAQD